jgi:hypothetical protein
MAKTLQQFQQEFGYPILTPDEVRSIREATLNWNSLEGEFIRRKCLKSYPAYLQATNYGYQMTPYHYSLAANLQRDFEKGPNPGMPYGLILLSASPQTGKSLSVTESFQSWVLIRNPRLSVLTLGYESTFASRFGRRNREKFSEYAPLLTHGKVKLHDKIQSTETWETMVLDGNTGLYNSTNGGMATAGMGGPITGKTGNVVVIDDPIKNMQDADSEVKIVTNIEYFQSAIETRLLGNPGSLCIVMCTRWVVNDLIGWLRRNRKKFIVGDYNYAAQCTEQNKAKDPLGREVGEGICPEMDKGKEWAEVIKESYTASQGGHVYNALFQGEPTDEMGNLFRNEDWQEYEIDKVWKPDKFDRIYLSIDATFKDNKGNDYVAMKVGGVMQGNDYARYIVRKRMDLPDTLDKIVKMCKKFPEIDVIYIEDKANGPGIVSVLRKWRRKLGIDEKDFPSVYPLNPEGGKYSRAQTASPFQREGRCYIPCEKDAHRFSSPEDFEWEEQELSYTNCFKHELGTFPFGANDDLVDCHTQAILKNIPLLTGEEQPEKRVERFTRYSAWWPEMWEDYNSLSTREEKNQFIRMHGAPLEWKTNK